jgi:hypothetical protein
MLNFLEGQHILAEATVGRLCSSFDSQHFNQFLSPLLQKPGNDVLFILASQESMPILS